MTITERKERERAEMRRKILEAALQLFTEQGFESVTVRQIVKAIEYSPATIYLYFKDKDAIFFEIMIQGFQQLYEQQLSIQHIEEPMERLTAHGQVYFNFAIENKKLYEIMFVLRGPMSHVHDPDEFRDKIGSYQLLVKNVGDCIDAGYFAGENRDVVAFSMWSLVHGAATLLISGRLVAMPEEYKNMLVQGFQDILGRLIYYEQNTNHHTSSEDSTEK